MNLDELRAARALVNRFVTPTPQYEWPLLSAQLGVKTIVKHENHTPTGAFKVRGGLVYIDRLMRTGNPPPRLITATRGNHGQSIPFAARPHGLPVTVLVPEGNSRDKNAAMRGWGAEVEVYGVDFDTARLEAERRAAAGAGLLVPSFHDDLILGVATYAAELFENAPPLDAVYVPIGMGSGICALIRTRDLLGLPTRIIGVVSAHADAMARAFETGEPTPTASAHTFADGIATRMPNPDALAEIRAGADHIVCVTDAEIAEAIRLLFRTTHQVAEGAGAAACAALAQEQDRWRGKTVGIVITGGNIDPEWFRSVLGGSTPAP
ncbi:MAG: threonine dehydratase [Pseudomonadales bacterium]